MPADLPPTPPATHVLPPIRVVLAEDEAIIRLDLKETLVEEGYEVVADTGRGDEAVELTDRLRPDLAILDIKMPGLDGIEAARRIIADGHTAVLILTAFSQRDLVRQAGEAGALAYLVKPFQRHELVAAIEIAMARHREYRTVAAEAARLSDQLETRKLLDRAKGRLIDEHGLTEQAAFTFIQRSAMSERRTMAEIAAEILDGTRRPDPPPSASPGPGAP